MYDININVKSKFLKKTQISSFIRSDLFQLGNIKKLCFLIFVLHIYENCYLLLNFNFKKLEILIKKKNFLFFEEQFLKKFFLK